MYDLEATLYLLFNDYIEEENKKYTLPSDDNYNVVYVFDKYIEYKKYFTDNELVNRELMDACRLKTTKKGTIIALKSICDYAITINKEHKLEDDENYVVHYNKKSNIEKIMLRKNKNTIKESNIIKIAKRKRK